MALDPSIPLSGRPAQIPGPLEMYGNLMGLKAQQQQMDNQRQLGESLVEERQAQTIGRLQGAATQRAALRSQQIVDELMSNAMVDDPATGVSTFDRQKFEHALIQNGQGHRYPELAASLDKLDQSNATVNKAKRQAVAEAIYAVKRAGNSPDAVQMGVAILRKNRIMDAEQLSPILDAIDKDGSPEFIGHLLDQFGQAMPEYQALVDADEKRQVDRRKSAAEAGKVEAETSNLYTYGRAQAPEPPSLQSMDKLIDGRPTTVNFNPKAGTYEPAPGVRPIPPREPASGAQQPEPPGDWSKSGQEFLATIPQSWRKTVEKIARYEEDPQKTVAMRGGMRETIMRWVNAVNPDYDQVMFVNRAPTRKAYTIGTQGQQINAINTAIGHIDQLSTVAADLKTSDFVPGNRVFNMLRTAFGSDKVTNFDTLKSALAGEVSSVLAKGGATVSGIAEAESRINAANSPQQLAGYVKTLIPIMGSKLSELDAQYKQQMGPNDPFSPLSKHSRDVLTKMGFDPDHPTVGGGGQSAAPGGMPSYQDYLKAKGAAANPR